MKTGFIGIGNMGGAIFRGYASVLAERNKGEDFASKDEILVMNRTRARCERAKAAYPETEICDSIAELVEKADLILLGVKPQGIDEVLGEIAHKYSSDKILVSMAAGVGMPFIEKYLGSGAKIIRIMPNTPAEVGESMMSVSRNANITDDDLDKAYEVLDSVGVAMEVDEDLIDCVIGVSGSSTAYTYMYIQALVEAAQENGMDVKTARIFAAQSVLGTAKLVLESEKTLEQLREEVCSPGGTTIEGVNKLIQNGFMDKVKEGFRASVDRSREMTREKAESMDRSRT